MQRVHPVNISSRPNRNHSHCCFNDERDDTPRGYNGGGLSDEKGNTNDAANAIHHPGDE